MLKGLSAGPKLAINGEIYDVSNRLDERIPNETKVEGGPRD